MGCHLFAGAQSPDLSLQQQQQQQQQQGRGTGGRGHKRRLDGAFADMGGHAQTLHGQTPADQAEGSGGGKRQRDDLQVRQNELSQVIGLPTSAKLW